MSAAYPQLTALDRAPVPYQQQAADEKPQESTVDDLEVVDLGDSPPVEKPNKFRAFIARFRTKRSDDTVVDEEDDNVPLVPSTNPEPSNKTYLEELLERRVSAQELVRSGFKVHTMTEHNIGLQDIYDCGYSVRDLSILIPEWEDLMTAGFNKHFLGDRWQINHLVTFYKPSKMAMCQQLDFTLCDLMMARTTPTEYQELGIGADALCAMQPGFEELFAMHYTVEDMVEIFGLRSKHMMDFNLTPLQRTALAQCRGWDYFALTDTLGMSVDDVERIGMGLVGI